jgi:phosphopantothenoylcysteine decarboxylase/phosphopantothenate--cysteine ligase
MATSYLTKDILSTKSNLLAGKTIVHCLTGSVSIMKAPEISRLLIRNGADVQVVMTEAAAKLIGPDLMEWATGKRPIIDLTGKTEHIGLCGKHGTANLVVIAPCTANTIGKIASGIDDTSVTTVVSTALGSRIPLVVALAMHEPMYENEFVVENIERLKRKGVFFVEPKLEESKAKMASPERIVQECISRLAPQDLKGKRVIVTAGSTVEYIDPIRIITNESSGRMGIELARECANRGARVALIYGKVNVDLPTDVELINAKTTEKMKEEVDRRIKEGKCDYLFAAAAPSDFRPRSELKEKVSTRTKEPLVLELEPTPKVISSVKRFSPKTKLVAFKADSNVSEEDLVKKCKEILAESGADLVIGNDVGIDGVGFGAEDNEGVAVFSSGKVIRIPRSPKSEFAKKVVKLALSET